MQEIMEFEENIKKYIPYIIEAFVMYYGEENRKFIENKLNNIQIICFYTEKDYINKLNAEICYKIDKLINDFFDNSLLDRNKFNYYMNFKIYNELELVDSYYKFITLNDNDDYIKENAYLFLKYFFSDIKTYDKSDKNYFNNIKDNYDFKQINIVIDAYNKYLNNKKRIIEPLKLKLEEKLNNIQEIKDIYYLHYKEEVINIIKNDINMSSSNLYNKFIKMCIGDEYSVPCVSFFTKDFDNIIKEKSWKSKGIIDERKQYFRCFGKKTSDLECINIPNDLRKLIPSEEVINKLINLHSNYLLKINSNITLPYFIKQRIEKIMIENGLSCNNHNDNISALNECLGLVDSTSIKISDKSSYPLVFINMMENTCLEKVIIHELNHVFESNIINYDNNYVTSISGWSIFSNNSNSNFHINYNLFNEIINEIIAQEITCNLHSMNIYMGDKDARLDDSDYEKLKLIVQPFFQDYKEVIIESRKNNNINLIFDFVGKENFDALNDLIYEYNTFFNNMDYEDIIDSLSNKNKNVTRAYNYFLSKNNLILNNIRNYIGTKEKRKI